MLTILWADRVTYQKVLERMGKEKKLLITIKVRKLEYTRNNQYYKLLQIILQGNIEGKIRVGRR